jgi:hypothetical protein
LNDFLIAELTANEGGAIPGRVFRDDFSAVVDADPNHPVNLALARNDVMDWAPAAPTRLYYCVADDQVPFENSVVAEAAISALNPPNFDAIDLGNFNHVGCVTPALFATINNIFEPAQGTLEPCSSILSTNGAVAMPFEVFPNPASNAFTVRRFPAKGELVMMDAQGRTVLRQLLEEGTQTIAVDGLNAGLYCLDFRTEAGRYQTKLVVQR